MPHFADMVYQLGGIPVMAGIPFGKNAKYYFVDPANGSDSNDGLSLDTALATLIAAEAKTVANQHDTVFYIGGATKLDMSAALTWDHNYTHLIGVCAPTMVAQRARIMFETGTTAASPLLDITASGCIFKNIYIFHGIASATNFLNVQVTGGRNYFENVHFAGGGHATQAVDGGASLALYGAEECTFVNCTIGVDTIAAATGMMGVRVDSDAKRCIFKDCNFTMYAGNSGSGFVEVVDSAGFDRYLLFDRCLFLNDAVAYTMASAFVIPSGMGSATHRILLKDCAGLGFTDWDASARGIMYLTGGTQTLGGTTGLMQVAQVA